MKKTAFFFLCFFATVNITKAQVFCGLGLGTQRTINTQVGVLHKESNAQLSIGYLIRYFNTNEPNMPYINLGYRVKLHNDIKITATPSIGIARLTYRNPYKVSSKLDHGKTEVTNINSTKTMFSLEIGKEIGIGRIYVSCSKISSFVNFGIGIKAFTREFEQIGYDPDKW